MARTIVAPYNRMILKNRTDRSGLRTDEPEGAMAIKFPIYMDHAATTPCDPRVVEAMLPYFTEVYGNPGSRNHRFGWEAEEGVDRARAQCAALIGADEKEVIFTSGATESNNLAIKGAAT